MYTSEYPKGYWKTLKTGLYQFRNDEISAVYGEVELHEDIPEGHFEWFYSARVCLNARKKDERPIEGYAPSLNYAKEIVETILYRTLTCKENWQR
jgi:hypothetical protein